MKCVICNAVTAVVDTRTKGTTVVRVRQCYNMHKLRTVERASCDPDPEPVKLLTGIKRFTDEHKQQMVELVKQGWSYAYIQRKFQITSFGTLQILLGEHYVPRRKKHG